MNAERIHQLDRAWAVYREWLESNARQWNEISFAEWLHLEYEKARKEDKEVKK